MDLDSLLVDFVLVPVNKLVSSTTLLCSLQKLRVYDYDEWTFAILGRMDSFSDMSAADAVLVNSFIVSRIDYCNSLLAGMSICQLERIQSLLNSAARLFIWPDTIWSRYRSAARQPTLSACSSAYYLQAVLDHLQSNA